MFRPRIIPVLLLKGRGLVKTIGFSKPTYIGDPINAVKLFNDMLADELIFLDITATKEERTSSIEFIQAISEEAFMPFAIGGGIKSLDHAGAFIRNGAEKVVIGSALHKNGKLLRDIADTFGSQSVVACVDYKKTLFGGNRVFIKNGTENTGMDPVTYSKIAEDHGAGEIMLQSIDRDGKMNGMDVELVKKVSDAVRIPVIACGGAGNITDLQQAVFDGHASAAAAGSMFVYYGAAKGVLINYPDRTALIQAFNKTQ